MRHTASSGSGQLSVPPVTPTIARILLLVVTAFVIEKIASIFFGLNPYPFILTISSGFHPVQIFTHPFVQGGAGAGGILSLLFTALILWSFGSDLERLWGSYNFLRFFYFTLLGGMLLSILVGLTLMSGMIVYGIGAAVTGVLVAYAMIWPDRQVLFFMVIPIRMKWLVVILLLMLGLSDWRLIITEGGGALFAALFLFYYARKGKIRGGNVVMEDSGKRNMFSFITDPIENWKKKKRLEKKQKEINERIHMQEELDRILEKISKEGMKSLTKKEKQFLDRASKELP